jgi:hypothetical protein
LRDRAAGRLLIEVAANTGGFRLIRHRHRAAARERGRLAEIQRRDLLGCERRGRIFRIDDDHYFGVRVRREQSERDYNPHGSTHRVTHGSLH